MLIQVDKMNAVLKRQKLFEDPELKGLLQFLEIPKKIKYEYAGVMLDGEDYVTPVVPLYTNLIRLQIVVKDGPIHKMMKTIALSTRHKMYREKGYGLIGEYVFWNMMMNGWEFIDTTNNMSIDCDVYYEDKDFIVVCYSPECSKYFKLTLKEVLILMFKYHQDKFKQTILDATPLDDNDDNWEPVLSAF